MNPQTLLNIASKAIEDREIAGTTHWLVCYYKGKIQCIPRSSNIVPEYTFMIITDEQAREGMTGPEWGHLIIRLAAFFERITK